jgi:Peptidase family S41
MKIRRWLLCFAMMTTVAGGNPVQAENTPSPAPVLPSSSQGWSQAAQRDVEAAYIILRDNHPGMVDPATPGFLRQLDRARATGLDLAKRVTTPMGYDAAIAAFGNELQDGHASANAILPLSLRPVRNWPGFVPAWRGKRMLVHFSSEAAVPRGAEIISCDGVPIRTLALRNVFRFRGRPNEAGNWWVQARNVLVDTGNPFVTRPTTCRLRHNGKSATISLKWRADEGGQFSEWRSASYNGVNLPIGMTNPASGITWIAMPDFEPDDDGIAAYQRMNTELESQRDAIIMGRAVVLDLRGNQGGSSRWSRDIAKRLWGKDAVNIAMGHYFARSSVVWRASEGNEAHVRNRVASIRAAGFGDQAEEWLAIADQMATARAQRRGTIDETMEGADMVLPPRPKSDLTIPVYVIVPGQCASACLDALDVFTQFPNTVPIGAPSSGDSKFMEVRGETLPSGLASVTVPNKMWINRPRGHSVGYFPKIEVTDLDWSTDDFLRRIEADLK